MIRPAHLVPALFCIALLNTACARLTERPAAAAPAATPSVLDYCEWLNRATPEELAEERRRLEADQPPILPVVRSVSLALLLSLPRGGTDEARAIELLNGAAAPADDAEDATGRQYRQFGTLWRAVLEERLQRGRETGEFAQSLAQEREQARDLQEKNDALQKQIEALKSIEQQMNRRGQPRGGNP